MSRSYTLSAEDVDWLSRIVLTLESNEVDPKHKYDDFKRLRELCRFLKNGTTLGPETIELKVDCQTLVLTSCAGGQAYTGEIDILDTLFYVRAIRVNDTGNRVEPNDDAPLFIKKWFESWRHCWKTTPQTVTLPGIEGLYVIAIFS